MDKQLRTPIFFQLSKFDSIEGIFEAVATAELPDKSGEVCHYESTKPYYQKWSDGIKKASGGKSLGNIRAMHQPIAAGKVTALDFDDEKKLIRITGKIVDKAEKEKMAEGIYTGVSQGGAYIEKWQEGDYTYYTADPSEISIVDNPCLGEASFEYVKADGTTEIRKLHTQEPAKVEEPIAPSNKSDPEVVQGWQAKDGSFHKSKADALKHNQVAEAEASVKAATAQVDKLIGDINDKLDNDLYWKREFSDDERKKMADSGEALDDGSFPIKTEQDLKNAIRAVGRAKDPAKAKEHIKTRAKALGLESLIPDDWKVAKAKKDKQVSKDLHTVARAACLIQELEWLCNAIDFEEAYEEDDTSQAPEHLEAIIHELCAFLTTYAEEECSEMVEDHGGTGIELALEAAVKLPASHARAIGKLFGENKEDDAAKSDRRTRLRDAVKKAEDMGFDEHDRTHGVHEDRVHAIHKAAGRVMQHCMKAMHEMHDEEDDAEKITKSVPVASDHMKKAHGAGHEIMQHCMKMGSKIEASDDDAEKIASDHALAKSQALNTALNRTISDMTTKLTAVLKRVDHLERQPAVRKGVLFDVKASHEAEAGSAPVETAFDPYNLDALRLSPEEQRRIGKTL